MNPIVRTVLKFLFCAVGNSVLFYLIMGLITWNWGQNQMIYCIGLGVGWSIIGEPLTRFITKIFTPKKKEA